jgi:hypothetical protein
MFEFICLLTGAIIAGGMLWVYSKSGDALHPAVVIGPLFIYFYCVWPLILNRDGQLEQVFPQEDLIYTSMVFCLSIASLYLGLQKSKSISRTPAGSHHLSLFAPALTPKARRRLYWTSLALGGLAVAAYWYSLENVGGFVAAYSRSKGGGWAESGYIGEAVLLSYPAVLLLALSRQGMRMVRITDVILALIILSPHLLQGTFGGRRGPLFLSLSALLMAWFVARSRIPSLRTIAIGVTTISLAVVAVASQRQHIYLGSDGEFDISRITELVGGSEVGEGVEEGNEYVMANAAILTANYHDEFYWGRRYFVTFFVRPIPKQLWPTKYEDMGFSTSAFGDEDTQSRFGSAVGFSPVSGASTGSIADAYLEFWWGVLPLFYLVGRAFAFVWRKHRLEGGLWTVILIEMLIPSVYLPSQSFSAWLHRVLIMVIVTVLVWNHWLKIGPPRQPNLAPQH